MRHLQIVLLLSLLIGSTCFSVQAQTTIWSIPDSGLPGFGSYVAHAGDIDDTPFADFIVALGSDANGALVSMRIGLFGSERFQISTPPIEDIDGVGDINADNVDDFGVLSRAPATGSITLSIYSGSTGAPINLPLAPSGAPLGIGLKGSIEGLGDLDSDGFDDFAVALTGGSMAMPGQACLVDVPGVTLVYSGIDGSIMHSHVGTGGQAPTTLSRIGDLNGDGISEYSIGGLGRSLISQPSPCPALPAVGSHLEVFSGVDGTQLQSHVGLPLEGLGIEASEDINLDGFPDILTQSRDAHGVAPGQVLNHIISGADGGSITCLDEVVSGQPTYGIYPAGYIDEDFAPEYYVVGTTSIRLVSGADSDTVWSMPINLSSTAIRPVASLGDLNRDSGYELIVTQQNPSRITVISPITLPPASVEGIGLGFGRLGEVPPELSASPPPTLGQAVDFGISHGTPFASGALLGSYPLQPYALSTGHTIAIDLPNALPISSFTLDANGSWTYNLPFIANSTVIGYAIHIQAYALSASAPGAFELTNGVRLVFGPAPY